MKYIVEVDSNGTVFDSHGMQVFQLALPHHLELLGEEGVAVEPVSLNKIIKLKESGFDSDEIMKMNAEGML